jgi:hypothetical protein
MPNPPRLQFTPPPPEVPYLQRRLEYLQCNRRTSSAYMLHRLNQSLRPQNFVDEIHACTFDDGQGALVCYPLRISSVDVGTVNPLKVVAAFHEISGREGWGDIAMISSVPELDGTLTVDIGFTSIEDAVMFWTRDGKRVRGRYWDIQPISAVLGVVYIFRHPASLYPLSVRLHRLSACEVVETAITPKFKLNPRLIQIRVILTRLAMVNGEAPTSTSHLPPNDSLEDTMMLYSLEGHDWCAPISHILPKSVKKNMYMRIWSRLEHWISDPYHDCQTGEYIRRGIYYRTKSITSWPIVSFKWKLINLSLRNLPNLSISREMTLREQDFAWMATRWQAEVKFNAWNSTLLVLPPIPEVENDGDFVEEMFSLWNWYDDCAIAVQYTGVAVLMHSVPDPTLHPGTQIVEQSFLAADLSFGPGSRLIGVFGPDYVAIMRRIAGRRAPLRVQLTTSPREGSACTTFDYHSY